VNAEIHFGAYDRVGGDGSLGEEPVLPVSLDGLGDFGAGYADLLADGESGESDEHVVFVSLDTLDGDASDFALPGCAGIGDVGIDDDFLGMCWEE
jgi:hypothetical protein